MESYGEWRVMVYDVIFGELSPANTSTLIANVHQRCSDVDIWLEIKVEPTYICRRCFNVGKITLKQRRWNYVESMSIKQRCFNVEIWLEMKVEPTHVYRRCFNVDKTTLKQY